MTKVFGEGSPEWNEGRDSQIAPVATAARAKALTDFVGIAIHCGASAAGSATTARTRSPTRCRTSPAATPASRASSARSTSTRRSTTAAPCVNDTTGDPITDPFGQPGFPGFDGVPANVTLGYIAQMQEAGVPVTFGYISDAHDNHQNAFPAPPDPNGVFPRASGPARVRLRRRRSHEYDQAFATFFDAAAA